MRPPRLSCPDGPVGASWGPGSGWGVGMPPVQARNNTVAPKTSAQVACCSAALLQLTTFAPPSHPPCRAGPSPPPPPSPPGPAPPSPPSPPPPSPPSEQLLQLHLLLRPVTGQASCSFAASSQLPYWLAASVPHCLLTGCATWRPHPAGAAQQAQHACSPAGTPRPSLLPLVSPQPAADPS